MFRYCYNIYIHVYTSAVFQMQKKVRRISVVLQTIGTSPCRTTWAFFRERHQKHDLFRARTPQHILVADLIKDTKYDFNGKTRYICGSVFSHSWWSFAFFYLKAFLITHNNFIIQILVLFFINIRRSILSRKSVFPICLFAIGIL